MTKKAVSITLATIAVASLALAAKNEDFKKVVAAAKTTPTDALRITAQAPDAPETHESEEEEIVPAQKAGAVTSKPAPGVKEIEERSNEEKVVEDESAAKTGHQVQQTENAVHLTTKPATSEASKAHPVVSAARVSAEQSLKWLTNGNTRYVTKKFRGDGRHQVDRDRTKAGQHPHAIVLSCSDSRVPPELIFDQGLGEIFTIRVAGEALDASVVASIEYAVEHLGPQLLVVMGHTKCGAVETAIKVPAGQSAGSESFDKLLGEIRPHLKTRTSEKPSADLEIESALNADGVARDLLDRSALLKSKVQAGELKIKTALYWIDSGRVKFY